MSKWILGVVGVVFLGVLLDLVYPNGKTNKFCKGIFAIFALLIMINPIRSLTNFDNVKFENVYVDSIHVLKSDALINQIKLNLSSQVITGVDVEIESNMLGNEYIIDNIYVDITNIVLSENLENINKYEVITSEIEKVTEIDKSRIIIYG